MLDQTQQGSFRGWEVQTEKWDFLHPFSQEEENQWSNFSVTQRSQRKKTSFKKEIEMEEDEGPTKVNGEVW